MIKKLFIFLVVVSFIGALTSEVSANHSWGSYHWARTANPLTLKLGDNLASAWDAYLSTASTDWTVSSVLNTTIVTGLSNPKNCKPTLGRVEVCNSKYGKNGWLGIAQIWVSGSHITQAITKMNDTYFSTRTYNTPEWKQFVVCQEVGHIFGLDHQDENFSNANLNTCMDYTNSPSSNQHPNQHDYDQLEIIYAHLDATSTSSSKATNANAMVNLDDPSAWGKAIRESSDKKTSVFERDLGKGNKIFTFVIWAE